MTNETLHHFLEMCVFSGSGAVGKKIWKIFIEYATNQKETCSFSQCRLSIAPFHMCILKHIIRWGTHFRAPLRFPFAPRTQPQNGRVIR